MFKGEYSHSIDDKGRLIMPAKYRELLGEGFVITRGFDKCLFVFDQKDWDKFEEDLRSLPISKKNARDLQRFFIGGAVDAEIDKQGRVLVPQVLRKFANLEKDVVLIGVGGHIEIWNSDAWESGGSFDDVDEIAEQLSDLGIVL
ncbi:MAG: division/cell wall cluster transcriptional repressor MraZ [Lachnospiraceae bacterium]|nr:division/cell wall cluster transcriptional repressor MraZ [Lachnospiraceae bacterium]